MASASSSSGGASFTRLQNFYSNWKSNLDTDQKEKAAFAKLGDEDKKTVIAALVILTRHSNLTNTGIQERQLQSVLDNLEFHPSPSVELADLNTAVSNSFNLIMKMEDTLATDTEKKGVREAEEHFRTFYKKHETLNALFLQSTDGATGNVNTFISYIMGAIPGDTFKSGEPVFKRLEDWAKNTVPDGKLRRMALEVIQEMRGEDKVPPEGYSKQNLESKVEFFKDRFSQAYITLHPELTKEDVNALAALGLKGKSGPDVFLDVIKHYFSPLINAIKSVGNKLGIGKEEKVDDLTKLINAASAEVKNKSRDFILSVYDRVYTNANELNVELNRLGKELNQDRLEFENTFKAAIATGRGDDSLLEKLSEYEIKAKLLTDLMGLRESFSEKSYLLLHHLSTEHGNILRQHSDALMGHVAFAVDARTILEDPSKWPQILTKMEKERGIGPVIAFRSLVLEKERAAKAGAPKADLQNFSFSPEHLKIEQEAGDLIERAMLWLQFGRARGDLAAPVILAEIITKSDAEAWSPDRADKTFQTARLLIREAITKGKGLMVDPEFRKNGQKAMLDLNRQRFYNNIVLDRPMTEQSEAAHNLIVGINYLGGPVTVKRPTEEYDVFGLKKPDFITFTNAESLKIWLRETALAGSVEAVQVLLKPIQENIKKGKVDFVDIRTLAEFAAAGFEEPKALLQDAAKMKSFTDRVQKDADKGKMTSLDFRSLALLAAHGSPGAKELVSRLKSAGSTTNEKKKAFLDSDDQTMILRNLGVASMALTVAEGRIPGTLPPFGETERQNLLQFYQTFIEPHPVDRQIPPYKPPTVSLVEINNRANRARVTENDVNQLLGAIKNGQKGAEGALRNALAKMVPENVRETEAQKDTFRFADWVLRKVIAPGKSFPESAGLSFPDKEIYERYERLLDPSWVAFVPQAAPQPKPVSRSATQESLESTSSEGTFELPQAQDDARTISSVSSESLNPPDADLLRLHGRMMQGNIEAGEGLVDALQLKFNEGENFSAWEIHALEQANFHDIEGAYDLLNLVQAPPEEREAFMQARKAFLASNLDLDFRPASPFGGAESDVSSLYNGSEGYASSVYSEEFPPAQPTFERRDSSASSVYSEAYVPSIASSGGDFVEKAAMDKLSSKPSFRLPDISSFLTSIRRDFTQAFNDLRGLTQNGIHLEVLQLVEDSLTTAWNDLSGKTKEKIEEEVFTRAEGKASTEAYREKILRDDVFSNIISGDQPLGLTERDLKRGDPQQIVDRILTAMDPEGRDIKKVSNLFKTLQVVDRWIEGLKVEHTRQKDKDYIEKIAPQLYGALLGNLFFSEADLGDKLGVSKGALAEFIIRNRALFLEKEQK